MAVDLVGHRSYFCVKTESNTNNFDNDPVQDPFADASASGTTPTVTAISRDLTWNSTNGEITIRDAGVYLIICDFSLEYQSSGTKLFDFHFKVGGTQTWPGASVNMTQASNAGLDPFGHTAVWLYNASAGAVIKPTVKGQSAGKNCQISTGAIFLVVKTEGNYGYAHIATNSTTNGVSAASEFLPFDSDNEDCTITTGPMKNLSYTQANGYFTLDASPTLPHGLALFLASHVWSAQSADGSAIMRLYYGSNSVKTTADVIDGAYDSDGDAQVSSNVSDMTLTYNRAWDPGETTLGALADFGTAGHKLYYTIQPPASQKVLSYAGTSMLHFSVANSNGTDPSARLSMVVDAITTQITAAGDTNVFDSDNWSGASATTTGDFAHYCEPTGITLDESAGTFTVANAGAYFIMWNMNLSTGLNLERTLKIQKNGSSILEKSWYINGGVDPQENSSILIADLESGDVLTFLLGAAGNGSAGSYLFEPHLTIFKMDERDVSITLQDGTVAEALIADDFTINTHAINTLSRQYDRVPDQVPFILGTRGPLSLRRGHTVGAKKTGSWETAVTTATTDVPPNVSTGDKKN
jgi:hypothetical protein